MAPTEHRINARIQTIDIRKKHVEALLAEALEAPNHFLAFDLINAAKVVWGQQYDPEMDVLAGPALLRARWLNQEYIDRVEDPS